MQLDALKTPAQMFEHWEDTMPDRVWLRHKVDGHWADISWAEAGRQARSIANALHNEGLQAGDRVGLFGANSPHWVIADLACMMGGFVVVPIYTTMSSDKVSYVASHSQLAAVFVDSTVNIDHLYPGLPKHSRLLGLPGATSVGLPWEAMMQVTPNPRPLPPPESLWTIAYTSGTTGVPKGVMHAQNTLPLSASGISEMTGVDENTRFFSYLPLAHVAERVLVELQSFYSGGLIAFNSDRDGFLSELKDTRPTFFLAVPRIWINLKAGLISQMGEAAWSRITSGEAGPDAGRAVLQAMGLDACTYGFSGAAPIAPSDIRAWRNLGLPLYEGFGQSEIMSGTANRPDADCIGSVGRPMAGTGGEVRISSIGEIELRAVGGMLGYYLEPEKTAETLVDGWIRTGDKGRIDEQGFLHITGRVKEIFKTAKGKYVAPAPIENAFAASQLIEQLCLVGSGLPQTVMLVVLGPASNAHSNEALEAELEAQRTAVNQTLEAHERISHVLICENPWTLENRLLTHTLKLLRDDVESHHAAFIERTQHPGTDTVLWETQG